MNDPIIRLLQAAYAAQAAIERLSDLSSVLDATIALGSYAQALLEVDPKVQTALMRIRDDQDRGVPSLPSLQYLFLAAWTDLYIRIHNANPTAA